MDQCAFSQIPLDQCRGVLIDLDDTLYSYAPVHEHAMRCVHQECFADLEFAAFSKQYRDARNGVMKHLWPQGVCRSRLFAFMRMYEDLGVVTPYSRAYRADEIYWGSFLENLTCSVDALDFLDRCASLSLPVCVVSDMTTHIQIRKLQRLGVVDRVAHLVTSEAVGVEKPDPRMFLEGMRKLKVAQASDVIMVGDSLEKDIEGAQNIGIRSYQISLGNI